jgi:hypothetical protein
MNSEKPALRGVLQDDNKDFAKRQTIGKIALWPNQSDKANAPKFRGILEIPNKGKFRITLWEKEEQSSSAFLSFCRYCGRAISDGDLLWDACNGCASAREGLLIPSSAFKD